MSTAFVLSGGASLGSVQVGMLAALADRGIAPDLLVGTSAGALNAAYLAGRGTDRDAVDDLAAVWRSLRTRDVFQPDPIRLATSLLGRGPALFGNHGLRRLIGHHLRFDSIEDAGIALAVVTADLLTGAEVTLTEGPATTAVLASSAIPAMLPPVNWGTQTLVDGTSFQPQSWAARRRTFIGNGPTSDSMRKAAVKILNRSETMQVRSVKRPQI